MSNIRFMLKKIFNKVIFYYLGSIIIAIINAGIIRIITIYKGWLIPLVFGYILIVLVYGGIYVSANLIHKPNEAYSYSDLFSTETEQARLALHSSIISLIILIFFYLILGQPE